MESRYPGDIRPVMAACAALAKKRASALSDVRKAVSELRDDVALAAMEMQQAARDRRAGLGQMKQQVKRTLSEARQSREQQVESLRARFARQRAETARSTRENLTAAKSQIQREVADLKARTRNAQASRFKSGSFTSAAAAPVHSVVQIVSGTVEIVPRLIRSAAVDTRFLDTFGS